MKKHVTIRVYGRVQGVFFRDATKRMADELGVTGTVRNEPDGSVCIEAEGESHALQALIGWSRRGPPAAKVDYVESAEGPALGSISFEIVSEGE